MKLSVTRIGLTAPGMTLWSEARPVLSGHRPYQPAELALPKPSRLPANERRRTTALVRLAFQAAEQVTDDSPVPLQELAMVFGSAGGDTQVFHQICTALLTPARAVSPTQFHNSVHNAAAGYWSIATQAIGPSTSLSAYDDTVGATLLEAAAMIQEEGLPVLCVVCDQQPVPPLLAKRPLIAPFAAALLLQPVECGGRDPVLSLEMSDAPETRLADAGLEALRLGNPAARILPLLRAMAATDHAPVVLPAPGRRLAVRLESA